MRRSSWKTVTKQGCSFIEKGNHIVANAIHSRKEAVFAFECRLLEGDFSERIDDVKQKLSSIQRVEGVEEDTRLLSFVDLKVHVKFADAQSANDLHWKLTKAIDIAEGLALIGVSSMLTDIFDQKDQPNRQRSTKLKNPKLSRQSAETLGALTCQSPLIANAQQWELHR